MMLGERPFSQLARVYDAVTDDVDYDDWASFILETVTALGWQGRTVLDLGCGTGNSSYPFALRGYDVTGLDASPDMLAIARGKLPEARFVLGDFSRLRLGRRFDLVISVFDTLNNLLEPKLFIETATSVRAHLARGGIFMFDVNTTEGLRNLWESGIVEGWSGEVHYRWEHLFDEDKRLAKVIAYCSDLRGQFTEVHVERPYDPPELRELLLVAGYRTVRIITYPSGRDAAVDAPRVWVVAAE